MGITGVGGAMGYAGYDVGKTAGMVHKGGFDGAVSGAAKGSPAYSLHGRADVGEGEEVKFTWIDVRNKRSYAICALKGFDPMNPVYKVKEWDDSGNVTQAADQESEAKTDVIVKPDGSRVLVMTMSVGGMETTMSLEISKPTEVPNENSEQDTDHKMPTAENGIVSGEMSNISTEA